MTVSMAEDYDRRMHEVAKTVKFQRHLTAICSCIASL